MSRPEYPRYRRLTVLIIGFLSVALLPIGLISVVQTQRVSLDNRETAEITLLALTDRLARAERNSIEHALGAADVLSSFDEFFISDRAACDRNLRDFVLRTTVYNFVGVIDKSGSILCSSSERTPNLSQVDTYADAISNAEPAFLVEAGSGQGNKSTITVLQPFTANSPHTRYVAISLTHMPFEPGEGLDDQRGLVSLATLDSDGRVLSSQNGKSDWAIQLPTGMTASDLLAEGNRVFSAKNAEQEWRIYTVSQLLEDKVFAVGIWNDDAIKSDGIFPVPSAAFPLLMWLTSLLVAILAMHRLVIRHVRLLSLRMRDFAVNRRIDNSPRRTDMPAELAVISEDFDLMALDIMRDEAELEDSLRSKEVLLKEVHHRVKNNLQIIASIMNIQLRSTENPDTAEVVQQLQERVLSLATIHQNLYKLRAMGQINVGRMIEDIVRVSKEAATDLPQSTEFTTELEEILLFPDQAVPLSLLVTEIVNAAIKNQASQEEMRNRIDLRLRPAEQGECQLEVSVTAQTDQVEQDTNLRETLISAFVLELGGRLSRNRDAGVDRWLLRFPVEEFASDARNY